MSQKYKRAMQWLGVYKFIKAIDEKLLWTLWKAKMKK